MNKIDVKNMALNERLKKDSGLVRKLKVAFLGKLGKRGTVSAEDLQNYFERINYSNEESKKVSEELGGKNFHYSGWIGNTLEFLPHAEKGFKRFQRNNPIKYNVYAFFSEGSKPGN